VCHATTSNTVALIFVQYIFITHFYALEVLWITTLLYMYVWCYMQLLFVNKIILL